MKIFTFLNTAEDAPKSQRAIGRIWGEMPGRGGGTVMGWHPVIVNAPTEEAARVKLQTWWDAELAKHKPDGRKAKRKPMETAPRPEFPPEFREEDEVEEAV